MGNTLAIYIRQPPDPVGKLESELVPTSGQTIFLTNMKKRDKILAEATSKAKISTSKIKAIKRGVVFIFFVFCFLCIPTFCHAEKEDIGKIYQEQTSHVNTTETETITSLYNLAPGGEIDEEIRCDNDGNPSYPWTLGQRIPSFIPNIKKISVRTKATTATIQYQLRAYVSTASIATTTSASVICTSDISAVKDTITYASLEMTFNPACELDPNTNYWIYIDAVNCETAPGVNYNTPKLARKYDAWGGRRYYDFYRTTSIINDYDLHAVISYASTTDILMIESEYTIPFLLYIFIFGLIVIMIVIVKF